MTSIKLGLYKESVAPTFPKWMPMAQVGVLFKGMLPPLLLARHSKRGGGGINGKLTNPRHKCRDCGKCEATVFQH